MPSEVQPRERGQILVLFVLSMVVMLLIAGLVVDGGYAYTQSRSTQNAADFAAMAGTRIIGEKLTGNTANGTAANVTTAVQTALAANNATIASATYVDGNGASLGNVVGAGAIPNGAVGVIVTAKSTWRPYFLGIIGMNNWTAVSTATAVTPGTSAGGGVLPVGMQSSTYDSLEQCPVDSLDSCVQQKLTSGALYIPGGFGWLKFGCAGYGLGQGSNGGCQNSQPFLDSEVGPPPNSYGCCTEVGLPNSNDFIGSLTGNEWADLSYYVQNEIPVWVPIWDTSGGTGSNAYYHIVGYGAIIFAGMDTQHGKWLTGSAISGVGCPVGSQVAGTNYCTAPGGAFTIGVTGAVHLVH